MVTQPMVPVIEAIILKKDVWNQIDLPQGIVLKGLEGVMDFGTNKGLLHYFYWLASCVPNLKRIIYFTDQTRCTVPPIYAWLDCHKIDAFFPY